MKRDLMEQIRKANQNLEQKEVPNQDAIWDRIEEKLDEKEKKRRIIPWKLLTVAASIAVVFTAGLWVLKGYQSYQLAQELDMQEVQVPKPVVRDDDKTEGRTEDFGETIGVETELEEPPIQNRKVATPQPKASSTPIATAKEQPVIAEVRPEEVSRPVMADLIVEDRQQAVQSIVSNQQAKISREVTETIVREETIIEDLGVDESISLEAEIDDIAMADLNAPEESESQTVDLGVIVMEEDKASLDEVVVVGYGSKKRTKNFKGSNSVKAVDAPKEDDLRRRVQDAPAQDALQGRAPGLEVQSGSGQPGAAPTVRIRGFSSIQGNAYPLYVVDGEVISQAKLATLNPNGISSVEVLKDAAATAIYGSQASNGVIIITTKTGKATYNKRQSRKPMSRAMRERLADEKLREIEPLIDISNEDYESFIENQFTSPKNEPLSTFSIDVDNASYSNVRRFINQGQTVPKDAVRIEEMINYFNYEYDQPKGDDPIAIHTEVSQSPWNENHQLMKLAYKPKTFPKKTCLLLTLCFC